MRILGIETSCDETGIAIYDSSLNQILSENIFSQASSHAQYGGVVPELASRDHISKLLPLISLTCHQAKIKPNQIDAIAYTAGPGLRGPLLTGAALANSLSRGWGKPCVGINHMEAHLLVNLLEKPSPTFPFLTLLISGGHCLLIKTIDIGKYELLGQSRDDAVGEAFDKVAKLLGLNYPGGPEIERIAKKGDPHHFDLPQPMVKEDNLDFSFSGLKTAVYYLVKKRNKLDINFKSNIAASFQYAVSETLINKCNKAIQENDLNKLVIGGGVASNAYLKKRFKENMPNVQLFYPRQERCTDNGAMVAIAGFYRLSKSKNIDKIDIKPKWSLSEI
ncbi:MAG: tRNA (adenosine(37)-N6)-threonylcarbamoyltransferase complex transferase subunit TsaD [Gammaproteobacteria bacterium]|nr:MAG: tRNA (adenosine(37)-N6)-threonylcarbamoyltransferase complex transferase subunit TsaD [Gammaproteobacteria bacterium]